MPRIQVATPPSSGAYVAPSDLNVFPVGKYGAVDTTGATDSSTAVLAAIAAAYAAGGGIVQFPAGTIRVDSQVVIPNDGHTGVPRQPPLTLSGAGAAWDGSWQGNGTLPGATVLDLRSTTGPAKIDSRGLGALTIENLTLTQTVSSADTNPFVQVTNTTLFARGVAVYGHSSLSGTACIQDAFVLGGTSGTPSYNATATGAFQGYGTVTDRCYFARIRRGIYARAWVNSTVHRDHTFSVTCGSDATAAGIQFNAGTSGGFCHANVVTGVLFESTNYTYGIRLTGAVAACTRNTFVGNSFWDGGVNGYYFETGAQENVVVGGYPGSLSGSFLLDPGNVNTWVARTLQGAMGLNGTLVISGASNYITAPIGNFISTGAVTALNVKDDASSTSNTIAVIGDAAHGFVGVQNAGAGVSRRKLIVVDGTAAKQWTLDPSGAQTLVDGMNLVLGTATGTKIGTATTQKLAFYNATPIVQPSGTPAAATDLATALTLVNSLRTALLALGVVA